jgi:hypothetical protein
MSDSLGFALAVVFAEVVPAAIDIYAAYWALSVRRALAGRIYRNHALWLGAVGILVSLTNVLTFSNNTIIDYALLIYYDVIFVALFAFFDSTVRIARRSDPLLRSILSWEKLRVALWVDVGGMAGINSVPILSPSFANSTAGNIVGNFVWTALAVVLFGFSAAALVIGARRSMDPVLRRSLRWLGVVLSLVVVSFLVSAIESGIFGVTSYDSYYSYPALPGGALYILAGYALYRSARSLAPINRLLAVEAGTISPADSAKN